MRIQREFKMQAHIISGVVMDIAACKVSHPAGIDSDATALRAARHRSRSSFIGAMWRKRLGRFKMQALTCWDA